MSSRRQCFRFADTGQCRFGNNCTFWHGSRPPGRTWVPQNRAPAPDRAPVRPAVVMNPDSSAFPPLEAVSVRQSDGLLFPTTPLSFNAASEILRQMGRDGACITSGADARRLVSALVSSNKSNNAWLLEDRDRVLDMVSETPGNLAVRVSEVLCLPKNAGSSISFSTYMGLIGYLTCESVVKSAAQSSVNALYAIVDKNINSILDTLEKNISSCVVANTFANPTVQGVVRTTSGIQVFKPVASLMIEYQARFETQFLRTRVCEFVGAFSDLFEKWAESVVAGRFTDPLSQRDKEEQSYILQRVRKDVKMLREVGAPPQTQVSTAQNVDPAVLAVLQGAYDGPGTVSTKGPRHSNDKTCIRDICLPPPEDELRAERAEYLPANVAGVPHHLPENSMARLLDIQFRLLRADAMGEFVAGVQSLLADAEDDKFHKTQLAKCLRERGGWYIQSDGGTNSNRLPILTNLQYVGLKFEFKTGLVILARADSPPGQARHHPRGFWSQSKRMQNGGLVAIVTKNKTGAQVAIANLTMMSAQFTFPTDPKETFVFGLNFIDTAAGIAAARTMQRGEARDFHFRVLLENPVLYQSVRPFLRALQSAETLHVPLKEYLVPGDLSEKHIALPEYAQKPGFTWDLSVLLREDASVTSCKFDPRTPLSTVNAREIMAQHGKLDPSQSEAVIDSLTRELALIQGPPGTGKTFTGVELLRVLFANKVRPIMLLGFTNHALDHILRATHDAGVTKNIVRLGSRSKDEVISELTLYKISQREQGNWRLQRKARNLSLEMREVEQELQPIIKDLGAEGVTDERILEHLKQHHPAMFAALQNPPEYVIACFDEDGLWTSVGRSGAHLRRSNSYWDFWRRGKDIDLVTRLAHGPPPQAEPQQPQNQINQHKMANRFDALEESEDDSEEDELEPLDLDFGLAYLSQKMPDDFDDESSDGESDGEDREEENHVVKPVAEPVAESPALTREQAMNDKALFLQFFGLETLPDIRTSQRSVESLLSDNGVWTFSAQERAELAQQMYETVAARLGENAVALFEPLARRHTHLREQWEKAKDDITCSVLSDKDLVGATTNGAANLAAVMTRFAPKVIVLEEAGQILEAHVLTSLFPSVEHVIAIGDPLQLRPLINRYDLSTENARGGERYRFDMSLMERLASSGLPMSQLQVQRRMRPPISSLIHNTLYPNLEDHSLVEKYPDVSGMATNLHFLDHQHREEGGGDSNASKTNKYEADMVCDLALYLLKQGCYSEEGDIVILCGYLGQLLEVRRRLAGKVAVVIDERDQHNISKLGRDDDLVDNNRSTAATKRVNLDQQILLRTVDNFQGEEAKIVILSLVRNAGVTEFNRSLRGTIGFLRSRNRTNVALSRAKHGLYILGNAEQLAAGSEMWNTIINELRDQDLVNPGFVVACARHKTPNIIDQPGQLNVLCPDGGCLESCDQLLAKCGHKCKRKCHADDPRHETEKCMETCGRRLPCGHPCSLRCFQECGKCTVMVDGVELPCGHEARVRCALTNDLSKVACKVLVSKALPTCEHTGMVPCSQSDTDLLGFPCEAVCDAQLSCCDKKCTEQCSRCQVLSRRVHPVDEEQVVSRIPRTKHEAHPCGRPVEPCLHPCEQPCGTNHDEHTTCSAPCLRVCEHGSCKLPCGTLCAPCPKRCTWACEHQGRCSKPCGMPCDRLPCDKACTRKLSCGHPCPSVCGEPCNGQLCPECDVKKPTTQLGKIMDKMMSLTLRPSTEELTSRTITLDCGHSFHVPALDAYMDLEGHYIRQSLGKIWNDVKQPSGFTARKTCPECEGPVTSRRYGRVTKRAFLDMQEEVVVKRFSSELAIVTLQFDNLETPELQDISKTLANIVPAMRAPPRPQILRSFTVLNSSDAKCIEPTLFECRKNNPFKLYGPVAHAWRNLAGPYMQLYARLTEIVNHPPRPYLERSNHSFSTGSLSESTSPFSLRLEALHKTLRVRLKLVAIAASMSDELWTANPRRGGKKDHKGNKAARQACRSAGRAFEMLALALLLSADRDARLAVRLVRPEERGYPLLYFKSLLLEAQIELQRVNYQYLWRVRSDPGSDNPSGRLRLLSEYGPLFTHRREAVEAEIHRVCASRNDGATLREIANAEIIGPLRTIPAKWSTFVSEIEAEKIETERVRGLTQRRHANGLAQ